MSKAVDLLRMQLKPEVLAEAEEQYQALKIVHALGELRQALQLDQKSIQAKLDISQPAVSRLEKRADMKISTLREYVEAAGGQLVIHAVFPDNEDFVIEQIKDAS
jgi:predicted XRE-type DNA-binding protein